MINAAHLLSSKAYARSTRILAPLGSHLPRRVPNANRLPRRRGKCFGRGPQLAGGSSPRPRGREANLQRRACVRRASCFGHSAWVAYRRSTRERKADQRFSPASTAGRSHRIRRPVRRWPRSTVRGTKRPSRLLGWEFALQPFAIVARLLPVPAK
jgi:hypothetical protein